MGRFPRPIWTSSGPAGWRLLAVAVVAALGAVAALGIGLKLETRVPAQVNTRLAASGSRAVPANSPRPVPASSQMAKTSAAASGTFRQVILPDVLITLPAGLTAGQIAQLRAVAGVRSMITFDGAAITVGGSPVNVIGVNPVTFRSWVPLPTASDQDFWSELAGGDFMAASPAQNSLGLLMGASYQLAGASTQLVRYGMAAQLGLTGVDLLVNQALSARLGLVRQVAALISAPGAGIAALRAAVSKILGSGGQVEVLRSQQAPAATAPTGTQPTTYLQLFKASAAEYCAGLSWTVLAAIAQIESADGQNMGPSSAGALGPMQFLPSTWSQWGIDAFGQAGPPDVMNPYDAVPSAARLLCADGAGDGGAALSNAIFDYNHANWYVSEVLALAAAYGAAYA